MSEQKRSLKFDSLDSVLSFAISKEEEAYHFYLTWSDRVKDAAIKEVLLEFAREELRHKELIIDVKAGKPFEAKPQQVYDLKIGDYFNPVRPTEEMTYQDALQVAIQREIGARKLYDYLASISEEGKIKKLFESLAKEEAKHKMRLEQIYDDEIYREN